MSAMTDPNLNNVAETLLIPLYFRAVESQRPNALIKDEKAVALVKGMQYDFSRFKFEEHDRISIVLRNREFDHRTQDFLLRNPAAVVVHIGCGLDTRFERVDNGRVEWYDLDLPEVIALRRKLTGDETERYHLLACSAFDDSWFNTVGFHRPRPFLFLAEGVLVYFEEAQVKALVLSLRQQFPGAELVCDAFSPFMVKANNRRTAGAKISARYHWALKSSKELEKWAAGIRLLDEWFYLQSPDLHLEVSHRWMRYFPPLAKGAGIYHYRLGEPAI